MKRNILFFVLLLIVQSMLADSYYKRIDRPEVMGYGYRKYTDLIAVELSDTATVLVQRVDYTDGLWFCFSDRDFIRTDQGECHHMRALDSNWDIKMGDHYFHPHGHEVLVRCIYPPIPRDTKWIDVRGDESGAWGIYGIRLDTEPAPLPTKAKTEHLPQIEYKFGIAEVKGRFMDYHDGMFSKVVAGCQESLYMSFSDTLESSISPSGEFSFRIPVTHITPIFLTIPYQKAMLIYVGPDETTEVVVHSRQLLNPVLNGAPTAYVTRGPLSDVATELNMYPRHEKRIVETNLELSPEDNYAYLLEAFDALQKDPYMRRKEHSPAEWVDRSHIYSPAAAELIQLNNSLMAINFLQNFKQGYDKDSTFLPKLNNYSKQYSKAIDKLRFDKLSNPQHLLCPTIGYYLYVNRSPIFYADWLDYEKRSQAMANQLKDCIPFDVAQYQRDLKAMPKAYREYLTYRDKQLNNQLSENQVRTGYTIRTDLPDVPKDQLYEALRERYRGKVIFLVAWEPGLNSEWQERFIRECYIPIQEEYKDRDIAWVTISDITDCEALWRQKLTAIRGDHYGVDRDTYLAIVRKVHGSPETYAQAFIKADGEIRTHKPFWVDIVYNRKDLNEVLGIE